MTEGKAAKGKTEAGFDRSRLGWHTTDNLRWLADNKGADYLPCGMLHGVFLTCVADEYDKLVAENRAAIAAARGLA